MHQSSGVTPWSDEGDLFDVFLEGEGTIVLEENETLESSSVCELLSRLGVDVWPSELTERLLGSGVEISQTVVQKHESRDFPDLLLTYRTREAYWRVNARLRSASLTKD